MEDFDLEDDPDDPRDALVSKLIEYRKFKDAALKLKEKEEERQAKAAFDKKQKEKNMSFEELLNQYGNQGSKF